MVEYIEGKGYGGDVVKAFRDSKVRKTGELLVLAVPNRRIIIGINYFHFFAVEKLARGVYCFGMDVRSVKVS